MVPPSDPVVLKVFVMASITVRGGRRRELRRLCGPSELPASVCAGVGRCRGMNVETECAACLMAVEHSCRICTRIRVSETSLNIQVFHGRSGPEALERPFLSQVPWELGLKTSWKVPDFCINFHLFLNIQNNYLLY